MLFKSTQFYKPKTLIMEHTITNFKRASLFLLLFYAVFSSQDIHAQAVTEIITDYTGYWKSGAAPALNPVKPQNSHDLLSFTFNGQRYSTGVNDALLTTNGDAFSAQKFIALPMDNMSGTPTSDTYIGVGQLYDGVNNGPSSPPPLNNLAYYLTDGVQGLNIGTCATNIPQGFVSFQVTNVNPASIGDGIPDILITQIAQPSGTTDIYSFKDINGNNVGSTINIRLDNLAPVGNWLADFYRVNSNPMVIPPGFVNTERPMRLWAADFSDFGITAGNYQNIDHFVVNLKGTSDIAFVAYNFATAVITPLTPGISLLKDGTFVDTNGDCRASVGDKVNYTFKVTNTGQSALSNIMVTDPMVTVSGAAISLAPGATNSTNFTATYTLTPADIAAGAVYNRATVSGRDPENSIVTKDSSDPTPVGSASPFFHADCPECTVTVLLQTPTITLPLASIEVEGCATSAITGLAYSETSVSITPAQFIAAGGTISNISLVLSLSYQDTQSGTCPIIVTRRFSVTSGCLVQPFIQTITIKDTVKPTANVLADLNIEGCNAQFPVADITLVTGEADNCTVTPTVAFLNDSTPVTAGCVETVIRTYRVSDACGNFLDVTQNLIRTSDTTLPTASNPADIALANNDSIPAPDVTVVTDEADNCSTPVVAFVSDSAPTVTGCNQTVIRTYSVTDACNNRIEVTQNLVRNLTASAPVVGAITQPTCGTTPATGTVVLTGLPAQGSYTIQPINVTTSGESYTATLAPGTYTFTFSTALGCTSAASVEVVITAPVVPSAPVVGTVTQPTCDVAGGTVELSGLPAGNWTINSETFTFEGSGTTTTLTNVPAGTHLFTVTVNNDCTSPASLPVTIIAASNPDVPTVLSVTQPTCTVATGIVELSGLPDGQWTISPTGQTGTGATATINLPTGSYDLMVTNSLGCNSRSVAIVINAAPEAPATPVVETVTQPTCASATGSVVLTGLPDGPWTINGTDGTGSTYTVIGLSSGVYSYAVTVAGCTSASVSVTINAAPTVPSAPIVGTVTQPSCTVATGSVVLSGLPEGDWTINGTAGTGSTYTVSGLTPGTYTYTVTAGDCTSAASVEVVITAPTAQTAPIVGTVTQPTCAVATGSIELTGLPAGQWTINGTTGTGATYVVSGLTAGTYAYTVTNADGCTSDSSAVVTINAAIGAPSTPVVGTITQPTCTVATGSIELTGLPSGTYTINGTAGTGSTFTVTGLTPGTYSFSVTNADGCVSSLSAEVILVAAGETVNLTAYAKCNLVPETINLATLLPRDTALNGQWFDVDNSNALQGGVFNPLNVEKNVYTINYVVQADGCIKTFTFEVTVDNDCIVEAACPLEVFNAFSPNGDGENDVFMIDGIEVLSCYPTNSVEIYNRWGILIYETQQYDNNTRVFRGYSEGRVTLKKSTELPTGTYFYMIKFTYPNGDKGHKEGYLYLKK